MRTLRIVLFTAVAVSVVHYLDNYFNYADYPQPEDGLAPSKPVIGIAWFAFTAFAIAGYRAFAHGRERLAALLLAVYSGSGLVGFGHYSVDMSGQPWWRHAHIVADIACGIAVLAFCLWSLRRPQAERRALHRAT
jgi:O-antigen ligase